MPSSNPSITTTITISDIIIEVMRKNIRNLRLAVCPPEGNVRLSVPAFISDDDIHQMLMARMPWIKRKRAEFERLPKPIELDYISGEYHQYQGEVHLLTVIERHGKHELILDGSEMMLYVRPNTSREKRALVFDRWYRQQLDNEIQSLLEKWQPIIKKQISHFTVKKMKTKWGSCNIAAKRMSIALSLAKKPAECLEYVLVHELVHLHERYHNTNFYRLMDHYLPDWHARDEKLQSYG